MCTMWEDEHMTRSIGAYVVEGATVHAQVVSDQGVEFALRGDISDAEPAVAVSSVLETNPALRRNLWAYAKTWFLAYTTPLTAALSVPDPEAQEKALAQAEVSKKSLLKQADAFAKTAQWIADVADDLSSVELKHGWCSACYTQEEHWKSNRPFGQLPVYVCQGCGAPTLPCFAPECDNMAVRDRGAVRVPQFCAEHRHDLPGFEKSQGSFGELYEYEDYLNYEKPNLDRRTKIVATTAVVAGTAVPLTLLAAPAIGGAIGSLGIFGGLSGAAATSHGLALLGGGSIATGGLGMAGGTAVVTAVGAAVGGALGASVTNAYLREDSSFRIELLRPGKGGVPVLVANGFLSDNSSDKWGGWKQIVDQRYPNSPVYRVMWGAKELKDFGVFGANAIGKAGAVGAVKAGGAVANKAAAKALGGIAWPAFLISDLAKNPWHVAKSRADKTGAILGDLLARTTASSYVLIGHSLGARAMVVAAQTLTTNPGAPRIEAAHLLGAAIGAKSDWTSLAEAVDEAAYCYHSSRDMVLKYVYAAAQAGQRAAGLDGFKPDTPKIINIDVSELVATHFEYQKNVVLAQPGSSQSTV
ncbi:MAG: DUF726 domain-containing protein [Brooklawnia sp.]|nr:DUF726 domain-containing protein [Brooklawnia sp.]